MRCQQCEWGDVEFRECRQFASNTRERIWLYQCPHCDAQYTATREDWTGIPFVCFLDPTKQTPTSLQGRVMQDAEDLLAINPDPEKRIWYGTDQASNPLLLASQTPLIPFPRKERSLHAQSERCSSCHRSTIPIYYCATCGTLVCFTCSLPGEHGRVCVACAPSLLEVGEKHSVRRSRR